ncbi:MAG TPA: TIGR02302 family protein, partial [Xanthobacteraceae bacterium]|nr:TIGR02302 family protein [Xanthobacteraceae bacterium]
LARAVGVIGFVVAIVAALIPLGLLRMPVLRDGLTRLDRGSGLAHRPATAIADELAVTAKDPYSLALWNAHVERALAAARALKAGAPSPRVAWRDPYAVRALVLLACIATFFAAGGERWKRVAAAFDWQGVVLPANFRVDAWVVPPAYTGKPPLVLPGIHPGDTATAQAPGDGPFAVPVNSTLIVRSTGNVNLDISGSGGVTPSKEAAQAPAGTEEHRFAITATGTATLRGAGDDLTWPFNAIPDNPPTIALTKDPQAQNRGSLLLSYRLEDDYGVTAAEATFARKDDAAAAPAPGAKPKEEPRPLYGPPQFPLVLPQARTKSGVGQTIKDLTDHPWAGAEVTMTLIAHDEGGNVGKSDPVTFQLPQRVFIKPLARALIEQRRDLAMDANARPQVITALDALAIAPEKFTPDAGVYLGLRSIFWSLVRAKSDDELRDVVTRLWQMAVDIEDGNMSDAQDALRNAENALQQALARGAGDDEIKQLMDKLREAMARYMQALAQQLKNNQQLARPLDPNAQVMTQRDL